MPYNFVADSFHTKTFFKRNAINAILYEKTAVLRFWPPIGGLGATYNDHLRLIGKRAVNFLLVLIELFSRGVTTEVLRANIDSKSAISLQRWPIDPKFQVEGVAPTNHSLLRNLS